MNLTHLHLMITHLPIFGSILGAIVLALAIRSKNNQTKIAGYTVLIISALGAGIAYLTGEEAEETVENLQGVVESTIETHEDAAVYALVSMIIIGILSMIGIILSSRKSPNARKWAIVTLVLALLGFSISVRTGYLGGQIRHTELSSPPAAATGAEHEEDE